MQKVLSKLWKQTKNFKIILEDPTKILVKQGFFRDERKPKAGKFLGLIRPNC